MYKKIIAALIILIIFCGHASAAELGIPINKNIAFHNGSNWFIDNDLWKTSDAKSFIDENEVFYVPLIAFAEMFELEASFDYSTNRLELKNSNLTITQVINEPFVYVNNVKYDDCPAKIDESYEVLIALKVYCPPLGIDYWVEYPQHFPEGVANVTGTIINKIVKTTSVKVDKTMQMVTVYGIDETNTVQPFKYMLCSTGAADSYTPEGTFRLKPLSYRKGYADWYYFPSSEAWIRYCTQISGDICFHSVIYNKPFDLDAMQRSSYNNLGSKASHGCIRLTVEDARFIWYECSGICVTIEKGTYSQEMQNIKNKLYKEKLNVSDYINNLKQQ